MNELSAKIMELGKPRYRKDSRGAYFYRDCLVVGWSHKPQKTVLIAPTLKEILAYRVGDVVYV